MKRFVLCLLALGLTASGCALSSRSEGVGAASGVLWQEPAWIRNGEPIECEGEKWRPTDEVENILDTEVYQAGTYHDVIFFLEKTDVRPFERLYTRFGKNRYRAFEK